MCFDPASILVPFHAMLRVDFRRKILYKREIARSVHGFENHLIPQLNIIDVAAWSAVVVIDPWYTLRISPLLGDRLCNFFVGDADCVYHTTLHYRKCTAIWKSVIWNYPWGNDLSYNTRCWLVVVNLLVSDSLKGGASVTSPLNFSINTKTERHSPTLWIFST